MNKKVVSCLLAATMVAGTFGCVPAYAESTAEDPTELSLFVDMTWFWYDKWGTDTSSAEMTKRTGVTFDVTRASADDSLPLLIAGGDLPDVVYASNDDHINALSNPDVCWNYDELMEKYPDIDLNISDEQRMYNETLSPDGKLYCVRNAMLPSDYTGEQMASGGESFLCYRKDILDELGLSEPTNMDEFEDVLLKVKEAYPDMVPLCWREGNYNEFFANQMGHNAWWNISYKNEDDHDSGEMALWLDCDGEKDVYATINRFAREGLINAETTTYDMEQTYELMESGKGFACISSGDSAVVFQGAALQAGDTEQVWKEMTTPFTTYKKYYGLDGWAGFFITKNCKDPEAAMKFLAYMRSDDGRRLGSWGIEGVDWEFDENGDFHWTDDYNQRVANGESNDPYGIGCWIFGDAGEERLKIDKQAIEDGIAAGEGTASYCSALYNQGCLEYGAAIKTVPEITFVVPKGGTDLKNKYDALMDAMNSLEAKVEFAATEEEFESAWTEMVDQANSYGMQEINEYATQQVADYRANNG